jgi:integrase
MPRAINRLSTKAVGAAKAPGYYLDGAGLVLQVSQQGTRSWLFRFTRAGRTREMGLGPLADVSLADARAAAARCRALLREGVDPIEHRRQQRAANAAPSRMMTFSEAVTGYLEAHEGSWRNTKHAAQWRATLDTYAVPVLGRMDVASIGVAEVMKVLEPHWKRVPETAKRLRGRVEAVLAWADVKAERQRLNPARWKHNLDRLLPATGKISKVEHFASMPYREVPAYMVKLRASDGIAARAVELAILTAARSGEVRGATWDEFNLAEGTWLIPAERMKAGRAHMVALPTQAVALLQAMPRIKGVPVVFPGSKGGKLSDMSLTAVLRRHEVPYTVHGFRSSFSTWAAECTDAPSEVRESVLAHVQGDRVAAAYQRSDFLAKRARLLQQWADHCDKVQAPATVLTLPAGRRRKA